MKEQIKVKTAVSLKCIAWNNEEVINWIFSIENGLFKQYEIILMDLIFIRGINGSNLHTMDFESIGIDKSEHVELLKTHIKKLVQIKADKLKNENENDKEYNEGNVTFV
eukprot:239547_1